MKKFNFKFGPWSEHQIHFHSEDSDIILFELLLEEHDISCAKDIRNSILPYTTYYFTRYQEYRKAQNLYDSLKKGRKRSFRKNRYLAFIITFLILVLCIITAVILELD